MKIVLTAFEAFNGLDTNSSQEVLAHLNTQYQTFLLPVSYEHSTKQITTLIHQEKPDLLICLGQAGNTPKIRIERKAYNEAHASIPDNDGILGYHWPLHMSGPKELSTKVPIDRWIKELEYLDFIISEDPGRYICNATYYHALLNHPYTLFIHLPYYEGQVEGKPGLHLKIMVEKLETFLAFIQKQPLSCS